MAGTGRDRRLEDEARTLADLSHTNRVVAVSADGNDMGRLFSDLATLESMALASEAVRALFRGALEDACAACTRGRGVVRLVAGGDDIRAFLGPEDLLAFVGAFAQAVAARGAALGTLGGALPGDGLARVGVGVGAALAGDSYPASQLMDAAHSMEREAKRICRGGGVRSAFALLNLVSGEAQREGSATADAISLDQEEFARARRRAESLAGVPATQRQRVLELRRSVGPEELANAFRYQVARSGEWQAFLKAVGVDWRDPDAVAAAVPLPLDEELARLVPTASGHGGSR